MEKTFREVTFAFIPQCGFSPDEDERKELEDLARRRDGVFYGTTEVNENGLKTLLFVIEDEETGSVYHVDPTLVEFKK